jgi:hypothetical protein
MTLTKNTTKSMTREKSIKKRRIRVPVTTREKILLQSTSKTTHPRIRVNIEITLKKMNPEVTSSKTRHVGRGGLYRWLPGIDMLSGYSRAFFCRIWLPDWY